MQLFSFSLLPEICEAEGNKPNIKHDYYLNSKSKH